MARRSLHYEAAFEAYVRARRIPYVAVDEAKKSLLPPAFVGGAALKSFDFVLYGETGNLLVEIKGRRVVASGRLENWVTREDVTSLLKWECLFGSAFEAAFIFVYHYVEQPPDAFFEELFEHQGLWYGLRVVNVREYAAAMRTRSQRWGTIDLARPTFERISGPFAARTSSTYGDRLPAMATY